MINRRRASSSSIYDNRLISQLNPSRNSFVNYDYLDSEEHDGYTNAWLRYKRYRQFPNEYTNEYTEKWVEYASLRNEENHRIQHTRAEFFDILKTMREEELTGIMNQLKYMMQDNNKSKIIYQPIRNPINPIDNIVKGFEPGIPHTFTSTTGQLCARCKARLI